MRQFHQPLDHHDTKLAVDDGAPEQIAVGIRRLRRRLAPSVAMAAGALLGGALPVPGAQGRLLNLADEYSRGEARYQRPTPSVEGFDALFGKDGRSSRRVRRVPAFPGSARTPFANGIDRLESNFPRREI